MNRALILALAASILVFACDDEPAPPEPTAAEREAEDRRQAELDGVEAIERGDIRGLSAYLRELPDGEHASRARETIRQKLAEQMIRYRFEAARLAADPLLVLAAVEVFEAFADQAPAAIRFESLTRNGAPPEGIVAPTSPDAALAHALGAERLAQYVGTDEAVTGLAVATDFAFMAATPGTEEMHEVVVGDGAVFYVERGVGPADVEIGTDEGHTYRSLTATVHTEVRVPAHGGRPARTVFRDGALTPTSFQVEFTQVEGLGSTNDATRHRAVYDAILTSVGSFARLGAAGHLAFFDRPQDFGSSLDIPVRSRALDAVVTSLEGTIPGVEVGSRCRIQAGRGDREGPLGCRVGFVCAGQELYGHARSGFIPCPGNAPSMVNDEDPSDGDPALSIDTAEQRLSFRDDATGRFGEVTLEARLIPIDAPTPPVPAGAGDDE